jgi:hypothetical protein
LSLKPFIDDFWTKDGRNLEKPDLACLRQDHLTYRSLLMQPVGHIWFNDTGIGLTDAVQAEKKFKTFFDIALAGGHDLVITPEYSCPWKVVNKLLEDDQFPDDGKLWIIGCQSIQSKELLQFVSNHSSITWIFEQDLVNKHLHDDKFFDPVLILFRTLSINGEVKYTAIIQFKTMCFGGAGFEWERDNMVTGNHFYIVDNKIASTKLVVFICSDTLETEIDFNSIEGGYFVNPPLLLVHIQLNQSPLDTSYKAYRDNIFKMGEKENYKKEILCLNWAREVKYTDKDNKEIVYNQYGGSAWYFQNNECDRTDPKINTNHVGGLYYTYWSNKYSHIYFLNYDEHVFDITNTKPSQAMALPERRKKTGLVLEKLYSWNDVQWIESSHAKDGFEEICKEITDGGFGELDLLINEKDKVAIERLIELSTGSIELCQDWDKVNKLPSFNVSDTEINNRNNFTHDPDKTATGIRKRKIMSFATLKNAILTDISLIPNGFTNPELKYDLSMSSDYDSLLNLYSVGNERKGTAVYLENKTELDAKKIRDNLEEVVFKKWESQQGKNIFIWYNILNVTHLLQNPDTPAFNDKPKSMTTDSYDRSEERK